jgi:hypothetical protein
VKITLEIIGVFGYKLHTWYIRCAHVKIGMLHDIIAEKALDKLNRLLRNGISGARE